MLSNWCSPSFSYLKNHKYIRVLHHNTHPVRCWYQILTAKSRSCNRPFRHKRFHSSSSSIFVLLAAFLSWLHHPSPSGSSLAPVSFVLCAICAHDGRQVFALTFFPFRDRSFPLAKSGASLYRKNERFTYRAQCLKYLLGSVAAC